MKLQVPEVEKSCCGCSLETGTKIIAFIHIFFIGGIFLAAFTFHVISESKRFVEKGAAYHSYDDTFNPAFFRDEFLQMTIFGNVAFAASLIYGTYKKDKIFFEPWLILKAAVIFQSSFNIGVFLVVRAIGHKSIEIFFELVNVSLECYMFIVVHSLYKELKSNTV